MFKERIKTEAKTTEQFFYCFFISKVIEKTIHDQTQDYLHRNELLNVYHSGFEANHSRDTCLVLWKCMNLNSAENGKHTDMI